MGTQSERDRLRSLLVHTIQENFGEMPVSIIHAALAEVDGIIMSASHSATIMEIDEKIKKTPVQWLAP